MLYFDRSLVLRVPNRIQMTKYESQQNLKTSLKIPMGDSPAESEGNGVKFRGGFLFQEKSNRGYSMSRVAVQNPKSG